MKFFFLIFAFLIPTIAIADGPQPTAEQIVQAKDHYFSGEKAYRLGDFDKAINEFRASYDLNPVPKVLFNLGQSHYKKNDLKLARHFFRQFIETNPANSELLFARQKLSEIEAEIETSSANTTASIQTTQLKTSSDDSSKSKILPLNHTSVGKASVGLVATAVVFAGIGGGLLGHSFSINPLSAMSLTRQRELDSQASSEKMAGIVVLGIGGAAFISSAVLFGVWMHQKHNLK